MPMRGQQFKKRERAEARLAEMEASWNRKVESGYPHLAGKFSENYRIFEVPAGSTFSQVVNAIPGLYAATLGHS